MNLSTVKWTQWDKTQSRELLAGGTKHNRSLAVAEMGDRFATIDMGRGLRTQALLPASVNREPYLGAAVPLSVGQLGPHLTQCRLSPWPEAYLCTKWHLDPSNRLATIRQRYRQADRTGQRSRSIGPTVTYNGRPKISDESNLTKSRIAAAHGGSIVFARWRQCAHAFCTNPSRHPKRYFNRFSGSCRAHGHDRPTGRQTDQQITLIRAERELKTKNYIA